MSRGDRDPNRGWAAGLGRGIQRGSDRVPAKELVAGAALTQAITWVGIISVGVGAVIGVYKIGDAAYSAVFDRDNVEDDLPFQASASVEVEDASNGTQTFEVPADVAGVQGALAGGEIGSGNTPNTTVAAAGGVAVGGGTELFLEPDEYGVWRAVREKCNLPGTENDPKVIAVIEASGLTVESIIPPNTPTQLNCAAAG